MEPLKYSVVTFGCRVNQSDSLAVEEGLLARGARATDPEHADVVVVNTCSVTASADQAARQTIRRLARSNPAVQIVVTGCYATRRADEIAGLPNVRHVVPNDDKPQLVSLVRRGAADLEAAGLTTAERFVAGEGSCGAAIEPGVAGRTAFTLRVQTGCAEQCAYCIIPTTRGRPRSTSVEAVIAEGERVAAAGFKEIALTGVHLGSYGRDLEPRSSLAELLRSLAGWAGARGDVLLRLSSLEPMDCTPEVVELAATAGCFAPHFHLPLQHASDRVLDAMRRPYTMAGYRSLVDGIRARLPHAAIGTDVVVGFPGETEDDFAQLTSYLESSPLTHLHVFPYSDRPGTAASAMGDRASAGVVRDRARAVRAIGQRLTTAFRESQRGTAHVGLTLDDGTLVVTGNYLKLRIAPGHARNAWVRVRVTAVDDPMRGEVCS